MAARVYNILIEQGATFRMPLIWRDLAGNSLVAENSTARMQLRSTHASAVVLMELTTENGGIAIDHLTGRITATGSAALTEDLAAPAKGVYDLEVQDPAGVVTRLVEGCARISPEVTRT